MGSEDDGEPNGPSAIQTPASPFKAGELVQATVTSSLGAKTVWQFFTQVTGGLGEFTFSGQNLGDPSSNIATYGWSIGFGWRRGLDLFFANGNNSPAANNANQVVNYGNGVFSNSGQALGNHNSSDVAMGDMDGDGDVDAVVVNDGGQANRVWLNDGSGVFSSSRTFGGNNGRSVSLRRPGR